MEFQYSANRLIGVNLQDELLLRNQLLNTVWSDGSVGQSTLLRDFSFQSLCMQWEQNESKWHINGTYPDFIFITNGVDGVPLYTLIEVKFCYQRVAVNNAIFYTYCISKGIPLTNYEAMYDEGRISSFDVISSTYTRSWLDRVKLQATQSGNEFTKILQERRQPYKLAKYAVVCVYDVANNAILRFEWEKSYLNTLHF